jgi:Immunity protein 21
MTHERQWVWTDGGPLILLQTDLLGEWYGIDPNPSKDRSVATDYERACQVQDYAGVIPVGDGSALVLGEEPMDSTWWPSRDLAEGLIVRVLYSAGDEAVARLIESLGPESLTDTGLRMVITSPHLELFDSTCPGTLDLVPRLAVTVPIGRYAVYSVVLRDPGSHMIVVHRLVRLTDTSGDERPT